jgi:GNAT superfamily N-acetyltransferase
MVRDFGGINAPAPWAEAVSATIGLPTHGRMGILLHRLAGPPTLPRPAAGQAVAGLAIPLDLLRSWFDAFDAEVEPDMPHASITDAELRPHVPNTCIWFHQGRPVAMAVAQRPFHGGWAISRVYTPPEHRRRGYAGAVVHALCQAQLAAGARYLSLYTDLANPTSNRLYAAIGFVPVCDQIRLLWKIP